MVIVQVEKNNNYAKIENCGSRQFLASKLVAVATSLTKHTHMSTNSENSVKIGPVHYENTG